jgi:rubredoxin
MTENKHNREGNSGEDSEPDPGPSWRRMHRDWRCPLCPSTRPKALTADLSVLLDS